MIDSSSNATSAAAAIASGRAATPSPMPRTSRSSSQPTMPPAPAGIGTGVSRSTEQAKAPSTSAGSTSASRRAMPPSGRCSSSRNAQPRMTAGIRKPASPTDCANRSASSAPLRPRIVARRRLDRGVERRIAGMVGQQREEQQEGDQHQGRAQRFEQAALAGRDQVVPAVDPLADAPPDVLTEPAAQIRRRF